SRLRVGPHALAKGMLEGLPYVAILLLLLLLLLLLVLFLILLFIFLFLLCASRLSTRQSNVDGTLVTGEVNPSAARLVVALGRSALGSAEYEPSPVWRFRRTGRAFGRLASSLFQRPSGPW